MGTAACIVGSPYAPSRPHGVGHIVADKLRAAQYEVSFLDLSELQSDLLQADIGARRTALAAPIRTLDEAELLVVVSPIYKASYPGLLKLFFDDLPPGAFTGKVALPIMIGATERHALAVRYTLQPLLEELGAFVPQRLFIFDQLIKKGTYAVDEETDSALGAALLSCIRCLAGSP